MPPATAARSEYPSRSLLRRLLTLLLVPILGLSLAPPSDAYIVSRVISGTMVPGGRVVDWALTPDGRYVVFIADALEDGRLELFSAALDDGERVRLSHDLPAGADVSEMVVSADSRYVVYGVIAEATGNVIKRLYTAPVDGAAAAIEISSPSIGPMHHIYSFAISPDSQIVAYVSDHATANTQELFGVNITGGAVITLASCTDDYPTCSLRFEFTPNGDKIVVERLFTPHLAQLSVVGATGGAELLLSDADPFYWNITPNSLGVVYQVQTGTSADGPLYTLFGQWLTGGAPIPLSPSSTAIQYRISPNSQRVVYTLEHLPSNSTALYAVSTLGGDSVRLSGPLAEGRHVSNLAISPNSQGVTFLSDKNGHRDLYAARIVADAVPWQLNDPPVEGGEVRSYLITPNGAGVVYLADQETDGRLELYAASADGSINVKLNHPLGSLGEVASCSVSPNSQYVVYTATEGTDRTLRLFIAPITGGAVALVGDLLALGSGAMLPGVDMWTRITPDSQAIVYIADPDLDDLDELFLARNVTYRTYLPAALTD